MIIAYSESILTWGQFVTASYLRLKDSSGRENVPTPVVDLEEWLQILAPAFWSMSLAEGQGGLKLLHPSCGWT
jgi:hypothetical protein